MPTPGQTAILLNALIHAHGNVDEFRIELLRHTNVYPFLPCPICGGVEGCDHTVTERVRMNDSDGAQIPVDNYHLKNGRRLIAASESVVGKSEGDNDGE